jgi:hypothetical protein
MSTSKSSSVRRSSGGGTVCLFALCAALVGCAQVHVSDEVQPGIYELTIEREVDACSPTRPVGAMGAVGVLVERGSIDAPVPDSDFGLLTTPRVRLTADHGFHAETNRRIPGCESAFVHEAWTVMGSSARGFELVHRQSWHGLGACADAVATMPSAPAQDCESERRLRYDLASSCPAPCSLRLSAGSELACSCD